MVVVNDIGCPFPRTCIAIFLVFLDWYFLIVFYGVFRYFVRFFGVFYLTFYR